MISNKQTYLDFYNSLLFGKLSIALENQDSNKRDDILDYFKTMTTSNYIALLGRENNMIPFLTVEDNLLIGLSKKEKKEFLPKLKENLVFFKLKEDLLKKIASELSDTDQTILQIIRASILGQTIIIFDNDSEELDTSVFLNNMLPILKRFSKSNDLTLVIVTKNDKLATSNYYDQCILLERLYK